MIRKKKDSVSLICDVGELSNLFYGERSIDGFLQRVVSMVKTHMEADACSIFLYNKKTENLVLKATEGLNKELLEKLSINENEGLIGLTMRERQAVLEDDAIKNPHYKAAPGSGEDSYHSFLSVAIIRGVEKIGVLLVQHRSVNYFNKKDIPALRAIAAQLAVSIENVRYIVWQGEDAIEENKPKAPLPSSKLIKGQKVTEQIAVGTIYKLNRPDGHNAAPEQNLKVSDEGVEEFKDALNLSIAQLQKLQEQINLDYSDVASLIFGSHILILGDASFSGTIISLIEKGEMSAREAIWNVVNKYVDIFSKNNNERMQEKIQDILDLGHRLLRNLSGTEDGHGDYSGQIIVARDLFPSELIKFSVQHAEGLILLGGAPTAHISILAKAMGTPFIYTEDTSIFSYDSETRVIIDGNQGNIFINPSQEIIETYTPLVKRNVSIATLADKMLPETFTADKKRIQLLSSINLLNEIKQINALKSDGIGLYRSEFPFLVRDDFPTEEEQFRIYEKIVRETEASLVTLRTLDIGGDKILSYASDMQGENPFLGLRAIRFSLKNKKIFVSQLKAMLRAGTNKKIGILFPLISSLDDFKASKELVKKSIGFLERDGYPAVIEPDLGVMIELPSSVLLIEELAKEADFLSIGSNDLIQYMLGVDRTNSSVSGLFQGEHPAILKTLKKVSAAALKYNKPLSMCGTLSMNKNILYFSLGVGITRFSIPPMTAYSIQKFIGLISLAEAKKDAKKLLEMKSIEEINDFFKKKNF